MKLTNFDIVTRELPGEISLAISVSGCPRKCEGCHSPELREDIGQHLTTNRIQALVDTYEKGYITAICFLGGEQHKEFEELLMWLEYFYPHIKLGLYTGAEEINDSIKDYLHYYKVGKYILGKSIDRRDTNQKLFKKENNQWTNVTKLLRK